MEVLVRLEYTCEFFTDQLFLLIIALIMYYYETWIHHTLSMFKTLILKSERDTELLTHYTLTVLHKSVPFLNYLSSRI